MIINKPFWLLIMFVFLGGGLLFSEMISVVVVETGVHEDAPAIESSGIWESGLMDSLFEHGHIVSNAAMLRLNAAQSSSLPNGQLINIDEVKEGGSAYYILAVLTYMKANERSARPSSILLRLVQLYPNEVLYEIQIDGSKMRTRNDELTCAMETAETMIPYLKK